jgi:hypothetical protein
LKQRVLTTVIHRMLERIEGQDGDRYLMELLEEELKLRSHMAEDDEYKEFRSTRDGNN